jgi:FkbM family methyltransferase
MNYGNTIENELFWLGANGWEGYATKAWKMLSEQSRIIFDVGANTGLYSLISSSTNSAASVYAFEPVDIIFNRLKKNIGLNDLKVHLNKIALADEDGEGKIYAAQTVSHTFDQASLNQAKYKDSSTNYFIIQKRRLDSFIKENEIKAIDLMKIDVETFEPQVLEGMGFYLKAFAPTLLIEILNGEVARKVEALIDGIGYRYYLIDEKKGYIPKDNLTPGRKGNNFLLLNEHKHSIVPMIVDTSKREA